MFIAVAIKASWALLHCDARPLLGFHRRAYILSMLCPARYPYLLTLSLTSVQILPSFISNIVNLLNHSIIAF